MGPIYAAVGATGLTVGLYRYYSAGAAEPKEREKVFKGGDQGWIDLKLAGIEVLNHNTKKLRFELPDKEAVSGMPVTCELVLTYCWGNCACLHEARY